MKRILGPLLLVVLVLGVGIAIFLSVRGQIESRRVITIQGLIGSEKAEFFQDPQVIEALRRGGLEVHVEKAGSRQIATSYDLSEYDFAFPAGVPAAEKMRREQHGSTSYDIFFTPMAVASWAPIAQILEANGIAQDQGGYYTLDIAKLLEAIKEGRRWNGLEGSNAYRWTRASSSPRQTCASPTRRRCIWRWPALWRTATTLCRTRPESTG
jgi:hypothetical protein